MHIIGGLSRGAVLEFSSCARGTATPRWAKHGSAPPSSTRWLCVLCVAVQRHGAYRREGDDGG
jgi:hypothetical protein